MDFHIQRLRERVPRNSDSPKKRAAHCYNTTMDAVPVDVAKPGSEGSIEQAMLNPAVPLSQVHDAFHKTKLQFHSR